MQPRRMSRPGLSLALAAWVAVARAHTGQQTTYYADCRLSAVGIQDDVGTIYSPNYGMINGTYKAYPISCSPLIGIDASSPVQVWFTDFNMSRGDYCTITDTKTNNAYTFTGSAIPILPLLSKSISVRFFSNNDNQTGRGFILRWTTDYASLPTTTLPPISADATYISINDTTPADILSPGFPGLYPFGCVKDWVITAPQASQISLAFRYFYTEDTKDHLKILDGYDLGSEMLIGDYSGDLRNRLPATVVSSTPRLHLRFLADNTIRFNGFNIRASIYDPYAIAVTAPAATTKPPSAIATTTAASQMDLLTTVCLAVILPLIVVSAVVAGIVYVAWYQPRKLKYARQEALKHYAAMKEEYENSTAEGRPGSARPGSARPGSARPGSARPGSARPGTARPGSARPGSALYGQRPGTARQTLETVDEGPATNSARPSSAVRTAEVVHRPMSAAQRQQAVDDGSPTDHDAGQPYAAGSGIKAESNLLLTPGALRHPYQSLRDSAYDDGGQYSEPAPSIASLVGTKKSARIKAPPQILVNDGFVEDGGDDTALGAQGNQRAPPRVLPPVIDGARRLPPLSRPGQGLLSPSLTVAFQAGPRPSLATNLGSILQQQQQQLSPQTLQSAASPQQQRSPASQLLHGPAAAIPPTASQIQQQRAPLTGAKPAADLLSPTGTGHGDSGEVGASSPRPTSASGTSRPGSASARPGSATRNHLPSAPFYEYDDDETLNGV